MSDFYGGTFDPLADALPTGTEPLDLAGLLLEGGVPHAEVELAVAEGTIELLALEKIVASDTPIYELDEVAKLSGVSSDRIRSYWRALGFPDPISGEKLFSDSDLRMLSDVVWFISDGALEPGVALQMARVIGSSLERIASAQVDTIESRRVDRDHRPPDNSTDSDNSSDPSDPSSPDVLHDPTHVDSVAPLAPMSAADTALAVRRGAELLPMMPKMMEFVWRRHLSDAARRRRLRASTGEGSSLTVGFADLVGFTAQTAQLDEEQLAEVVGRFENIAYDVVTAGGGRVVKMIGDEVMFTAEDVRTGAELALALAETYRNEEMLSDVRVGLASGPVLEREGDVYGPVVNLASRIVSIAYPGAVVVAEDTYDALIDDPVFSFKTIRQHYLKDIGRVRLWTMRHADDQEEEQYRGARDRRAARRDFLLARRAKRLVSSQGLPDDAAEEMVDILEDSGLLDPRLEEALTTGDESTQELEAISDVVLSADIDEDLQVELLADLESARRLNELEREAQEKANEADLEAEDRLEQIEDEVRRKIVSIERDAQRRVEEALTDAERKAAQVNEEASRKVKRVADQTEKKADQAEKDARRVAKRKTAKRKAEKERAKKARTKETPGD